MIYFWFFSTHPPLGLQSGRRNQHIFMNPNNQNPKSDYEGRWWRSRQAARHTGRQAGPWPLMKGREGRKKADRAYTDSLIAQPTADRPNIPSKAHSRRVLQGAGEAVAAASRRQTCFRRPSYTLRRRGRRKRISGKSRPMYEHQKSPSCLIDRPALLFKGPFVRTQNKTT